MSETGVHVFETPGPVDLRVEVPAGAVRVTTWAEPRVEVEVTPVRGDERSEQALAETRVSGSERGGRHEVRVRAPKREGFFGLTVGRGIELVVSIRCPEGAGLELSTHGADLDVRGPLGDVTVRSASGDVTVDDTGSLAFTSASGDLAAGSVAGTLAVRTASGDVVVRSVGSVATVNGVSGDVRLGASGGAAAVKTVSGDVELASASATVQIGSVSGDVDVAVVPGLTLWVDAQSVSGATTSDFEMGDEAPEGSGGDVVELRVRTVSGDVRVARSAPRSVSA